VLGIRTEQLNRSFAYPNATDHQIRAMAHVDLVAGAPSFLGDLPRLRPFDDAAASTAEQARSYLDANCANCHRPGGTGNSPMDLRFATPLAQAGIVDAEPTLGDLGIPGARLVLPGDPSHSVLSLRMGRRDAFGMPSLGSFLVDQRALEVVESWIRTLPR
jgi:mono/diheme cytochrome c family protein